MGMGTFSGYSLIISASGMLVFSWTGFAIFSARIIRHLKDGAQSILPKNRAGLQTRNRGISDASLSPPQAARNLCLA